MTRDTRHRLWIVLAMTALGAAWLAYIGPRPVVRIVTPLPETVPFWYMLTAFPVLGMLVADLVDLWRRRVPGLYLAAFAAQIVLIVALSAGRLALRLPISGHALVVSYLLCRRLFGGDLRSDRARFELVWGVSTLVVIAYPKLLWWTDPTTFGVGLATGALLAALDRAIGRGPTAI